MTNDLSIDIDQIRSALTRVLDAVERDHGIRLHLDGDAYWSVPVGAAFDLSKSDPALTVGQLGDDVDAVRELLNDDGREIVAVWHELAHLVGVLRAVERIALPSDREITPCGMWVNYEALRVRLSGAQGLVCQHSGRTTLMPAAVGPWLSALIFLASRARGHF